MSRDKELQAIRSRYDEHRGLEDGHGVQVFIRGEVGILLKEIDHLTLLLADLHTEARMKKRYPPYQVIDGKMYEQRPDGQWQQVMGLE
jgi:hypothetical protein